MNKEPKTFDCTDGTVWPSIFGFTPSKEQDDKADIRAQCSPFNKPSFGDKLKVKRKDGGFAFLHIETIYHWDSGFDATVTIKDN